MSNQTTNLTIIGAGLWGKALAKLAEYNEQNNVRIWSRSSSESLASVIKEADVILSAVSMKGVRPTVEKLLALNIPEKTIFISATKGLETKSILTASQIWQKSFPNHPVVVLSGPNLSKEIDKGLPAATVVASDDTVAAGQAQEIFSSDIFRVYFNNDPIGTELGGTLKNVMAIASGVCDGLQLGTNAKSALLTRALPEMIRIGNEMGASPETFFGLSGLGDLIATCDSPLSRNYRVGYGLSEGKTLEQVLEELKSTAEGVNTANVLVELARKYRIAIPISRQVYRLLNGKTTPQEAVKELMARDLKAEFDDLDFA
ncbi:NAD(P)H-dependent glycerol-3-phosphate dehydrogenase [Crocosphaera chwakensis]|uniref:Glycerol-3-phosphate dehydrogenase [NAD(P)+] n=1 Tax=Crocosphaera chwakensis CCY0110 TaxID=391612 RepID=A3ITI9_9CHRO|nr:NAD(P)H-dependent glycerol-3-phosphate dehydrogenase [Crocosphaera chwakensis]EAZ90170.1 glycerol-3-phosphate dehydrogenase [Crocosphaera chwakensis CCY0110]